jgi:hypothetical protein
MDQLNYYDLENIISKCVSGEIDMHEPIEVTNKLKNQRTEMSILKHLLILCQSDKKSLIHILSVLRYKIKSHLLELINDSAFIRHYIQNVIHEWSLHVTPADLFKDGLDQCDYHEGDDLYDYGQLINEKKCSQDGGHKLKVLEDGLKTRQEEYKPMTSEFAGLIQDKVRDLHTECYDCMGRIKSQASDTMEKGQLLDPKHKDVIIDLSSKTKATYLEYSDRLKEDSSAFSTFLSEKQDLDIPDNIHTIFLNYLITLNMVKKEMNFITHSFKGLLTDIQPKMVVLTKFMDGLNELEDLVEDPEPVHQQEDLPELIIDNSGQVRQPDGGVMQNKNLESGGLSAIFGDGFSFF